MRRPRATVTTTSGYVCLFCRIATTGLGNGVRCDMAMLILASVLQKTWGDPPAQLPACAATLFAATTVTAPTAGGPPSAPASILPLPNGVALACATPTVAPVIDEEWWPPVIAAVKRAAPAFFVLGEVYWGLEPVMLRQGFDAAYDKTFTDLLVVGSAEGLAGHLRASAAVPPSPLGAGSDAGPITMLQACRFLENHDERRAPTAHRGGLAGTKAAAVITYTVPGMRFFHDGQFEGRTRYHSMHSGEHAPSIIMLLTLAGCVPAHMIQHPRCN